ncbi:MAG: hypothetical protein E7381_05385 [Clostridiales bacterium]|nr:hypothetical protein [Clostridiales bacterium]
MNLFAPIFNQMLVLFLFIVIGFILSRGKFVPEDSAKTLSKLENYVFVPALVTGTFITNCTVETLSSVWKLLAMGFALALVSIPLAFVAVKGLFKEDYLRKIATYGLAFSNFGFMGNAIVKSAFSNIFFEYTVFTLPFWCVAYGWGVPTLLIPQAEDAEKKRKTVFERIKPFINPMFIGVLLGMVIGLTGLGKIMPAPIMQVVTVAGDCMSPLAMILTGMTVGKIPLLNLFKKWRLYVVALFRVVAYPLLFLGIFALLALLPENAFVTDTFLVCGTCMVAMPMGLTSIFVPVAYGKDTTEVAGMVLISHLLSVLTIPLAFALLQAGIGIAL